jgi:hypothetical protein
MILRLYQVGAEVGEPWDEYIEHEGVTIPGVHS